MKKALLPLIVLFAFGCATAPQSPERPSVRKKSPAPPKKPELLDPADVQQRLGMERPASELGFKEKRFNACQLGLRSSRCVDQYLSVVHFRLLCRDSVGTVQSVSQLELVPVSSENVKWKLGLYQGRTHLDSRGQGQIRVITPGPSRSQKLTLMANGQALGVSAADITQVVVPKDWCN